MKAFFFSPTQACRCVLQTVLNALDEAVFLLDADGICLAINNTALKRLSVEESQVLNHCIYDFMPAEYIERRRAYAREACAGRKMLRFEERRDGRYYEISLYPVLKEGNEVGELCVFSRDITRHKATAEQEHANAERLRAVLESVGEGVTLSDDSGYFEIFNPQMEAITGYTHEEANQAADFLALIHPDPQDYHAALYGLSEVLQKHGYRNAETVLRAKDGTLKHLLISTAVYEEQGRHWFLSTYHDVSREKRAEIELRRVNTALELAQDCVFMFAADSLVFVYVNQKTIQQSGYSREELLGMTPLDSETRCHPG
jgi:PAS domain S-box-containing protein